MTAHPGLPPLSSPTVVASRRRTRSEPKPAASLPTDVFEVVVNALADSLVLDYQHDADVMVDSPQGKAHDACSARGVDCGARRHV